MFKKSNKGTSIPVVVAIIFILAILIGTIIFIKSRTNKDVVEEGKEDLAVIFPNGGENLTVGNSYTIKWEPGQTEKVDISIWMPTPPPGGWPPGVARIIQQDWPAKDGVYLWTIEENDFNFLNQSMRLYGFSNPAFKILIFKSGTYDIYDASDDNFSISR